MSPILGIFASSNSGFTADLGAFVPIATTTLASATASVTFSSIPSTYTHLQIRCFVRPSSADDLRMQINGDTTAANYYTHYINGNGSAAGSSGAGTYYTGNGLGYNSTTLSNTFGIHIVDILDYANTSKYKTSRTLFASEHNGSGQSAFLSGLWMNTAAISSIAISNRSGVNLAQYSSFTLYGIKG
jgi:hypothetical protein